MATTTRNAIMLHLSRGKTRKSLSPYLPQIPMYYGTMYFCRSAVKWPVLDTIERMSQNRDRLGEGGGGCGVGVGVAWS